MPVVEWLNKKEALKTAGRIPFRVLDEQAEYSYGDKDTQNMLIQGDNLDALKALMPFYAGKIKCIYIDPPYNTQNAFEHYDDNLEHSIWLSMMYVRLQYLRELLAEDGVIFVNIDEIEHAYLKVVLDELFGRKNFIGDLIWQKRKGGGNDSRFFAIDHDYIIVYAKNTAKEIQKKKWRVSQTEEYLKRYKEKDINGERYYWDTLARDGLQNPIVVTVKCPDGTSITINSQKSEKTIKEELASGEMKFANGKKGWTLHHRIYMPEGQVLRSILNDVGTNKTAADEISSIFNINNLFDYPKPEGLIKRLLELCTHEGDWVLDSFLGSGTAAAVAHKMNRKWIGIELGEHAVTHCVPRLKKVVDGEQGGISEAENWKGGGGFRFFKLGAPIFTPEGVINPDVRFKTLAAHIWFCETETPLKKVSKTAFLGEHSGTGYYLLFNGILGDKRPDKGNVLTKLVLKELPKHSGPKVIYGELSLLSKERLKQLNITFKQIPYDVRAN